MGEARRRKTVSRPGAPVEDFRVPDGKFAITVEVDGADPSTVIFDADMVGDLASEMARLKNAPPYHQAVAGIGKEFLKARRDGGDLTGIGVGILWSALYHPKHGERMRVTVSRSLRDQGKVHVTWSLSAKGLGLAVADQFVDMDRMFDDAPRDHSVFYERQADDDQKPN
jgi:hypothetical protein